MTTHPDFDKRLESLDKEQQDKYKLAYMERFQIWKIVKEKPQPPFRKK